MILNENITRFIEEQAKRRGWNSNADLKRNIGFTEATWSRIMRRTQDTISDDVAAAICDAFNVSVVDLHLIAEGSHKDFSNAAVDKCGALADWLRKRATPAAFNAVFITAEALGFSYDEPESGDVSAEHLERELEQDTPEE